MPQRSLKQAVLDMREARLKIARAAIDALAYAVKHDGAHVLKDSELGKKVLTEFAELKNSFDLLKGSMRDLFGNLADLE